MWRHWPWPPALLSRLQRGQLPCFVLPLLPVHPISLMHRSLVSGSASRDFCWPQVPFGPSPE